MQIVTTNSKPFKCNSESSILDEALKANLVLEYSCKNGQCGVCRTTLLEGKVVELQPQIALTKQQDENNQILTCCCAPLTNITIDAMDLSALHNIEIKTFPARIKSIKKLTSNIIEVTLRLPPTAEMRFLEGQYIDVIKDSIRRSYSIASTSTQKEVILLIKYFENGEMSNYWFHEAKENDLLRIEGPKGTFFLRDNSKPLIFLATGTGIAPIMSILKNFEDNIKFNQQNKILVYWGNRSQEDFVWHPNFKKINVEFVQVCSKPTKDWSGESGYVQNVAIQKNPDLLNYDIYACGSINMIQSAKELFIRRGIAEKQFYSDAFVQSF